MDIFLRRLATPSVRQTLNNGSPRPLRHLHARVAEQSQRTRVFFSSRPILRQEVISSDNASLETAQPLPKPKTTRSPPGKISLRRVAVEAQRSRTHTERPRDTTIKGDGSNRVTAISVADQFDMDTVAGILRSHGFPIDPDGTGFDSDQVIHTRGVNNGDIFVFPSGTLVAWSLPGDVATDLATRTLLPAAIKMHMAQIEKEDLEYEEDPNRDSSHVKGDLIVLGTKTTSHMNNKLKYGAF
jgi:uncharacterized Rmd1/YagE family protein